ncbi:hypothetical protein HID58_073933 [Brassica napus]|uniref:Uncharacterized protein n=1 Tax=Brassica napus TaxID=3708 RepID=A0ABQ7YFG6_BRANA|nr:hypothetical protein HID58_073933 [Brassica napus]
MVERGLIMVERGYHGFREFSQSPDLSDAPPVKHSPCHQWSFGPSMVCSGLTRKLPTVSQPDQIFWK